ncbi:MAG: hypothetical protein AAB306_06340 [Pseudomonadota bacterium]
MTDSDRTITIDGTEYSWSSLSDEAKMQITNLKFVENEIVQLKARLAIAGTAKLAYQTALKNTLSTSQH